MTACAGPFTEVRPGAHVVAGVAVSYCGSSSLRAASVVGTMDGPPSGETTSPALARPREVTLCVQVDNRGRKPLRVDRSHLHLKCPHEKQPWVPDRDEDRFVVAPGAIRRFQVTFSYSPLASGDDVRILFDDVFATEEWPIVIPPMALRNR